MPKRRRERDKPKSGPDALYNPNKRVLLSYASDEEVATVDDAVEQPSANVEEAAVDDRALANYQMTEYPDSESDAALGATVDEDRGVLERLKGAYEDVENVDEDEDEDEDEEDGKRASTAQGRATDILRKDPATNQWPKLGPVSYEDDDEYDPETEEAMAYLRDVRSERQTIPEILSAPHQFRDDADQVQDTDYRETDEIELKDDADDVDGAGVSIQVAPLEATSAATDDDATNPQKVFTRLLVERFMEQRKQLHIPPSMHTLSKLPDSCPISYPKGNNEASEEWYRLLHTTAPLPAQLRSMDQDTVLNILSLVQRRHLPMNCKMTQFTSAWIWSLLARLDDVGTMSNDEVFPLRELGKRALIVLLSFTNPELAAGLESLDQGAPSAASVETDNQQTAPAMTPTDNTLATLDMVLVVVGEVFRQRDLLEARPTWTATGLPA